MDRAQIFAESCNWADPQQVAELLCILAARYKNQEGKLVAFHLPPDIALHMATKLIETKNRD